MWFSPILTQRSMAVVHAPQCAWVSQLQTISLFSFPRARHKTWLKNACPVVYARATRYTIQKRSFHTLLQPKFIDWAQQKALSKFYLPHPAWRTPIRGIKTLANVWPCQACVQFFFFSEMLGSRTPSPAWRSVLVFSTELTKYSCLLIVNKLIHRRVSNVKPTYLR